MEDSFEKMATNSIPEVQRVSLATVCLRLLAMGVTELPAFPFLSPPTQASLLKAIELLINLGAVSSS
jgi:ATP-dependent helicase HrpA